jgi:hypothetical protein
MLGVGDSSSQSPGASQGPVAICETGFHPIRYRGSPNQISEFMWERSKFHFQDPCS